MLFPIRACSVSTNPCRAVASSGDGQTQDQQRRMLGEFLGRLIAYQATQRAQGLLRPQQRQLVDQVTAFILRPIAVAAQLLLDFRRIIVARPVDLHAENQVASAHRNLDVIAELRFVQRVKRIESQALEFRLRSLARGILGCTQLLNQLRDARLEFGRRPAAGPGSAGASSPRSGPPGTATTTHVSRTQESKTDRRLPT